MGKMEPNLIEQLDIIKLNYSKLIKIAFILSKSSQNGANVGVFPNLYRNHRNVLLLSRYHWSKLACSPKSCVLKGGIYEAIFHKIWECNNFYGNNSAEKNSKTWVNECTHIILAMICRFAFPKLTQLLPHAICTMLTEFNNFIGIHYSNITFNFSFVLELLYCI